jgi:hypothetical protein
MAETISAAQSTALQDDPCVRIYREVPRRTLTQAYAIAQSRKFLEQNSLPCGHFELRVQGTTAGTKACVSVAHGLTYQDWRRCYDANCFTQPRRAADLFVLGPIATLWYSDEGRVTVRVLRGEMPDVDGAVPELAFVGRTGRTAISAFFRLSGQPTLAAGRAIADWLAKAIPDRELFVGTGADLWFIHDNFHICYPHRPVDHPPSEAEHSEKYRIDCLANGPGSGTECWTIVFK